MNGQKWPRDFRVQAVRHHLYRIFEAWFDSAEQFQQIAGTPQWKKIGEDVPNFASGDATVLIFQIG
jgi:hypothetical protein